MRATIHFKDSATKNSVTIDNLTDIYAKGQGLKTPEKHYTADTFHIFKPYAEESYSFKNPSGNISISGAEILYVEFSH